MDSVKALEILVAAEDQLKSKKVTKAELKKTTEGLVDLLDQAIEAIEILIFERISGNSFSSFDHGKMLHDRIENEKKEIREHAASHRATGETRKVGDTNGT